MGHVHVYVSRSIASWRCAIIGQAPSHRFVVGGIGSIFISIESPTQKIVTAARFAVGLIEGTLKFWRIPPQNSPEDGSLSIFGQSHFRGSS